MTANQKLKKEDSFKTSTKGCLPTPQTLTGTITSAAKVVTGTGTLFTKELMKGMWIYSDANNAVREIDFINSDTQLVLKSAFTTPLAGETVKRPFAGYYRSINVANVGGASGSFNEMILTTTDPTLNFNNEFGLAPIAYDGSSTSLLINTGT